MSNWTKAAALPLLAAAMLAANSCASLPTAMAAGIDGDMSVGGGDWPNFGRDGSEQHFSPLQEITAANVAGLQLAWHYDLEPGFTVSAPVAADGKLFITTGHSKIRAFDSVSGALLWEFDGRTREIAHSPVQISWGNKGLSYYNGRIFIITTDGRVIALNADTGAQVWEQREFELTDLRNSSGAPRVFDGKVIVGHGGADISPIRGYVTAYDAMTGEQLWRFYTVPGDPSLPAASRAEEIARPTWLGDWYGRGGGGTAWNAFSYDAELDLMYIGVGNGFPYAQHLRSPGGGDNLFLSSIVAVDADTGDYRWHYQVCPAEQWDCTAVQDMTIGMVEIDGRQRKVVMQAPKNGFFYVLDAATGEYISAEKIARVTWASRIGDDGRPVENPGIRYQGKPGLFELWPGLSGAHSWLPQAFSPDTGLVYLPVFDVPSLIGDVQPGAPAMIANMGVTIVPEVEAPGAYRSWLKAWNPATQTEAWSVELPGAWPGGVMATHGGLVFQGRIDGFLVAYDAMTGAELWKFQTGAPVVAPPISYRGADGRQYVTVLTGNGSTGGGIQSRMVRGFNTDYRLQRRVLTFALGGEDTLPPAQNAPRILALDPDFRPDPAVAMEGGIAFGTVGCMVCHGMNAESGGGAPDLRYSPTILSPAVFLAIVRDGLLNRNGMPGHLQVPEEAVEAIRHYLRARALQTAAEIAGGIAPSAGSLPQALPGGM